MLVSRLRGVMAMTLAIVVAAACSNGSEPKGNGGLQPGQIQPNTNANSVTLEGGAAGADYVMTASNLSTSFATTQSVTFSGHGLDVTAPVAKNVFAVGPSLLKVPGVSAPARDDDF